jgi:hypothetical protein
MPIHTLTPTAFQSPDAVLSGSAVDTPSNTGHAETTTSESAGNSLTKSCRWHTFQDVVGAKTAVTLKITHTSNGALVGPTPTNTFRLQYTLNGGGAWINAVERLNFTSAQGPTVFSVSLGAGQDISQVQVRVLYQVTTVDLADIAAITATIGSIQLEVTTQDSPPITLW